MIPSSCPADLVVRETVDEIDARSGIVISKLPCHAASARGIAVAVVLLDEAAWWGGIDGSHEGSQSNRPEP